MEIDRPILRVYFSIFLIVPESVFAFISGILLSAAINIATSQLPNSIWTQLGGTTIVSMFLMFIASIFFIWLGISIKPHQDAHSCICDKDDFKARSKDWLSYLIGKNVKTKWSILLGLSISTTLASMILILT